jgi:hypothetical protein
VKVGPLLDDVNPAGAPVVKTAEPARLRLRASSQVGSPFGGQIGHGYTRVRRIRLVA